MKNIEYWILGITGILTVFAIYLLIYSENSPLAPPVPERFSALVESATGPFEWMDNTQQGWIQGKTGDRISDGTRIRTRDATVRIDFKTASLLLMGDDTDVFLVPDKHMQPWAIEVRNGQIAYKITSKLPNIPGAIRTPHALIRPPDTDPKLYRELFVSVNETETVMSVDSGNAVWEYAVCYTFWGRSGCNNTWPSKRAFTWVPEQSVARSASAFTAPDVNPMKTGPRILNPDSGFEYAPGYMIKGFNTTWVPDESAVAYHIELERKNAGRELTSWLTAETNAVRVKDYEPGLYEVRVFSRYTDGSRSSWSEPSVFSVGGRLFSDVERPTPREPIRFATRPYLTSYMIGGYVRPDLAAGHDVIFYVLTDQWWIQPLETSYRVPIQPDGYFESVTNFGKQVYLMIVRKDDTSYQPIVSQTRYLPYPDGKRIIFNMIMPFNTVTP